MKITIEKCQYDPKSSDFKTRTLVFETNEVSLLEAFRMVDKNLDIISINGAHDWRDRLFDEFQNPLDKVAPVIHPLPVNTPAFTIPQPWVPMRPLIGDPPGWPNNPTVICQGNTNTGATAMTQADGQGDDSGLRAD